MFLLLNKMSKSECQSVLEQTVSKIKTSVDLVLNWGSRNLLQSNPKEESLLSSVFQSTLLQTNLTISVIGIDISKDVQFNVHLEDKAKLTLKNLSVLDTAK